MFNWNDYLKIANDFLIIDPNSTDAQAYYRCGISRAYYSVYNKSEQFIKAKNLAIIPQVINGKREGIHQALIRVLGSLKGQASVDLSRLKGYRTDCDYNCQIEIDINTLKLSLLLATSIDGQLQ
jgi:hypothetical protein